MVNRGGSDKPGMSPYEAQAWIDLSEFWERKADRRRLPPRAEHAKDAAAAKIRGAASATGKSIANLTPQPVKDAGGLVVDRALDPALQAALGLLEWVTETVQRFSDPADIYKHHRAQGRQVTTPAHLQALDLEDLDGFTRWFAWQCRTTGVFEGAGMGLLSSSRSPDR